MQALSLSHQSIPSQSQPITEADQVKLLFKQTFELVPLNEGVINQKPFEFCTSKLTAITTDRALVFLRSDGKEEFVVVYPKPCVYLNESNGCFFFANPEKTIFSMCYPNLEDGTQFLGDNIDDLCNEADVRLVACFPSEDQSIYVVTTKSILRMVQRNLDDVAYEVIATLEEYGVVTQAWKQDDYFLLKIEGNGHFIFDLNKKSIVPAPLYGYFGKDNTLLALDKNGALALLKIAQSAHLVSQWVFHRPFESLSINIDISPNYILYHTRGKQERREAIVLDKSTGKEVLSLRRRSERHFLTVRLFNHIAVGLWGRKQDKNEYQFVAIHIPSGSIIAEKAISITQRITDLCFFCHKLLYVSEVGDVRTLHRITIDAIKPS